MLIYLVSIASLALSAIASPFNAPVPEIRNLEKRAIHNSFVGCVSSAAAGDVLVTPQSPDGCAVSPLSWPLIVVVCVSGREISKIGMADGG